MKKTLTLMLSVLLIIAAVPALAGPKVDPKEQRGKVDQTAEEILAKLFEEEPQAKKFYDESFGHAVFDATQTQLMISGGSGKGVAIENESGERIYMKMASAGAGVGLGVQTMFTIFLFKTEEAFDAFTGGSGWDADASASAAAGQEGANVQSGFVNEMMIFQLTDAGLIASASLKGTKYWLWAKLNEVE